MNGKNRDHVLMLQHRVIDAVRKNIHYGFAMQRGDTRVLKRVLLNSGELELHGIVEPLTEPFLDYFVVFGRFDEVSFRFGRECKVERSWRILRILV